MPIRSLVVNMFNLKKKDLHTRGGQPLTQDHLQNSAHISATLLSLAKRTQLLHQTISNYTYTPVKSHFTFNTPLLLTNTLEFLGH